MHDDRVLIEQRIRLALAQRIQPAIYGSRQPLRVTAWQVPGEPVPPAEGLAGTYEPFETGSAWGAPWSTTWFRFDGEVPADWTNQTVEAVIDLGFPERGTGFSVEGLVYDADGRVIKGLAPRNQYVPVTVSAGQPVRWYVEAAANPAMMQDRVTGRTIFGDRATAGDKPIYQLRAADLAVFRREVYDLALDVEVLSGTMLELPVDDPRRHLILRALERALDLLDYSDVAGTAGQASKELAGVLGQPAVPSAHRISAVGNAHIDSAWLWPLRETRRKVARTVANALALAETDPSYVFAYSQAQQLDWLKTDHPALFERVKEAMRAGWMVPVGGLWVEPDGNLPGGEAWARQMIYGKKFFLDEFGIETKEVWLPDSFGYSAGLPQLARLAGNQWMLTQKISWNQTNRFPHHTFLWEGIDGSRVFTHFPPVDTYNSSLSPSQLAHASRNFADAGKATRSLVPFGYGDGGGGPTREMLSLAHREANLEGMPRVTMEPPAAFFQAAEAEYADPPVWSGELYLELHRGVLTSQAKVKAGNRRSEHLLREAELWATQAWLNAGAEYPYADLERLWKVVLLLQFHDILPGTSIAWVYQDTDVLYAEVEAEAEAIIERSLHALAGSGSTSIWFNPAPHAQRGVPGLGATDELAPSATVQATSEPGGKIVLDNGLLRVRVNGSGLVTSIEDLEAKREVLAPGAVGNLLQIHPDQPNNWNAWDVDRFYLNTHVDLVEADEVSLVDLGGGPAVRVVRSFGASRIVQTLRLDPDTKSLIVDTDVDWHESEKFLKAAFPFDVHADRVASEIQFGHIFRPTHTNTSWDQARFETAAHRWVHVGEPDYGVALSNTATYGHDVSRSTRDDGGTTTTLRLSLLRAPHYPDPESDRGEHHFTYVVHAGVAIAGAVEAGYRTNLPLRSVQGANAPAPLLTLDNPGVVVEAVKAADDHEREVIVRLYESLGVRASGTLTAGFDVDDVVETDLLERPLSHPSGALASHEGNQVSLKLRPFQIVTLRLRAK